MGGQWEMRLSIYFEVESLGANGIDYGSVGGGSSGIPNRTLHIRLPSGEPLDRAAFSQLSVIRSRLRAVDEQMPAGDQTPSGTMVLRAYYGVGYRMAGDNALCAVMPITGKCPPSIWRGNGDSPEAAIAKIASKLASGDKDLRGQLLECQREAERLLALARGHYLVACEIPDGMAPRRLVTRAAVERQQIDNDLSDVSKAING